VWAGARVALGIALFFVGLAILRHGLRRGADAAVRRMVGRTAAGTGRAVAAGFALTFALQSASLVVVTLMGLLDSGAIPFTTALAVAVGGNAGASLTVAFLAFRLYDLAPYVAVAGAVLMAVARRPRLRAFGMAVLGFGVMYGGIAWVSAGAEALARLPALQAALGAWGRSHATGFALGALLTALVQSNGVANGILLGLGRRGLLSLGPALAVVVGANVGSGALALVAAITTGTHGRALAVANGLVNVFGALALLPGFGLFTDVVGAVSPNLDQRMAAAHILFNVLASALMLPLLGPLGRLSLRLAAWMYGQEGRPPPPQARR
jgi:phosphate:Na+ symporter